MAEHCCLPLVKGFLVSPDTPLQFKKSSEISIDTYLQSQQIYISYKGPETIQWNVETHESRKSNKGTCYQDYLPGLLLCGQYKPISLEQRKEKGECTQRWYDTVRDSLGSQLKISHCQKQDNLTDGEERNWNTRVIVMLTK